MEALDWKFQNTWVVGGGQYTQERTEFLQNQLSNYLKMTPNPQVEEAKLNSSIIISSLLGVSQDHAYKHYDQYMEGITGQRVTPISGWKAIGEQAISSVYTMRLGGLYGKLLMDPGNQELLAQIEEIEKKVPPEDWQQRNMFVDLLGSAARIFPFIARSVASGAAGRAVGSGVGALIGTFLLPGIGTTAGAKAGGVIGGRVGQIGGSVWMGWDSMGHTYKEIRQMDTEGVIPHEVNMGISIAAGIMISGIEYLKIEAFPGAKELIRGWGPQYVNNQLASRSFGEMARHFARRYVTGVTESTVHEVMEDAVQIMGVEMARHYAKNLGAEYADTDWDYVFSRLATTAVETFKGFAVLGIPGSAVATWRALPSTQGAVQFADAQAYFHTEPHSKTVDPDILVVDTKQTEPSQAARDRVAQILEGKADRLDPLRVVPMENKTARVIDADLFLALQERGVRGVEVQVAQTQQTQQHTPRQAYDRAVGARQQFETFAQIFAESQGAKVRIHDIQPPTTDGAPPGLSTTPIMNTATMMFANQQAMLDAIDDLAQAGQTVATTEVEGGFQVTVTTPSGEQAILQMMTEADYYTREMGAVQQAQEVLQQIDVLAPVITEAAAAPEGAPETQRVPDQTPQEAHRPDLKNDMDEYHRWQAKYNELLEQARAEPDSTPEQRADWDERREKIGDIVRNATKEGRKDETGNPILTAEENQQIIDILQELADEGDTIAAERLAKIYRDKASGKLKNLDDDLFQFYRDHHYNKKRISEGEDPTFGLKRIPEAAPETSPRVSQQDMGQVKTALQNVQAAIRSRDRAAIDRARTELNQALAALPAGAEADAVNQARAFAQQLQEQTADQIITPTRETVQEATKQFAPDTTQLETVGRETIPDFMKSLDEVVAARETELVQNYANQIHTKVPGVSKKQAQSLIHLLQAISHYRGEGFDTFMERNFQSEPYTELTQAQLQDGLQRAAVTFDAEGRAQIALSESADFTSFLHEFGHIVRRQLLPQDLKALEEVYGIKEGHWIESITPIKDGMFRVGDQTFETEAAAHMYATRHEEHFVQDFENYIMGRRTDADPSFLRKIGRVLYDFFMMVRDTFSVDPDVKQVLDRVFSGESFEAVMPELGPQTTLLQRVWHGSPYLFPRFDLNYAGTGEGGAAFGWGMYYSDARSVGEVYAKMGKETFDYDGNTYRTLKDIQETLYKVNTDRTIRLGETNYPAGMMWRDMVDMGLASLKHRGKEQTITEISRQIEQYTREADNWRQRGNERFAQQVEVKLELSKDLLDIMRRTEPGKAKLYDVQIADDLRFLDWYEYVTPEMGHQIADYMIRNHDLTPTQQARIVAKVDRANLTREQYDAMPFRFLDHQDKYEATRQQIINFTGKDLYTELVSILGTQKAASLALLEAGIDGIQYPAGTIMGVRTGRAEVDSSALNYTLFDVGDVEIVDTILYQRLPENSFFAYQDSNIERIHKQIFLKNDMNYAFAERIENAGDISRELSKHQNDASENRFIDRTYIEEKLWKIGKTIDGSGYWQIDFMESPQTAEARATEASIVKQYKDAYNAYEGDLGSLGELSKQLSFAILDRNMTAMRDAWVNFIAEWNQYLELLGKKPFYTEVYSRELAAEIETATRNLNQEALDSITRAPDVLYQRDNYELLEQIHEQFEQTKNRYIDTPTWMQTPNGKHSRLTEMQWVQTRTPAFLEWFGDWTNPDADHSLLLDNNGEPMVVYHGTNSSFTVFSNKGFSERTAIMGMSYEVPVNAIFFHSDASWTQGNFGKNVIPVYLDMRSPFMGAYEGTDAAARIDRALEQAFPGDKIELAVTVEYKSDPGWKRAMYNEDGINWELMDETAFVEALKNEGFDGATVWEDDGSISYAVFEPTQIKSANNNVGTFDVRNPSYLAQRRNIGGYKTVYDTKTGKLTVFGDTAEIRALTQEFGIKGRMDNKAGTVTFTATDSHKVMNILDGNPHIYSRLGNVTKHPTRLNEETGRYEYVGAPEMYNDQYTIRTLRKHLEALAIEGTVGKLWYEDSGLAILHAVNYDIAEAKKLAGTIAILSANMGVSGNATLALEAWAQYKRGQVIDVKSKAQNRTLNNFLYHNVQWQGEKTNNFYRNLLRSIDKTMGAAELQGVTVDLWMMRAFGYTTTAPTTAQYRFAEIETNRIAQKMNLEPHQVQAMIWTAMKARTENKGVKGRTNKESLEKGYSEMKMTKDGIKQVVKKEFERDHREIWYREAMKYTPDGGDLELAAFDFSHGFARHGGQLSWEATPHPDTNVLPGIHTADPDIQQQFLKDVSDVFIGSDGQNLLAGLVGLVSIKLDGVDGLMSGIFAPGVWDGVVSPGRQEAVAIYNKAQKKVEKAGNKWKIKGEPTVYETKEAAMKEALPEISEAQTQHLDEFAAALGYLTRQYGVSWHKPIYRVSKKHHTGIDVRLGRTLTDVEARALEAEVAKVIQKVDAPEGWNWTVQIGLVSSPEGMRIIRFFDNADGKIKDLPRTPQELTDGIHYTKLISEAVNTWAESQDVESETVSFYSQGNLKSNDWEVNPNGQEYASWFSETGRSDILRESVRRFGPELQAIYDRYSQEYGWGNPGRVPGLDSLTPEQRAPGRPDVNRSADPDAPYTPDTLHQLSEEARSKIREEHQDQVKAAVVDYYPVPDRVLHEYVDQKWAQEELNRRELFRGDFVWIAEEAHVTKSPEELRERVESDSFNELMERTNRRTAPKMGEEAAANFYEYIWNRAHLTHRTKAVSDWIGVNVNPQGARDMLHNMMSHVEVFDGKKIPAKMWSLSKKKTLNDADLQAAMNIMENNPDVFRQAQAEIYKDSTMLRQLTHEQNMQSVTEALYQEGALEQILAEGQAVPWMASAKARNELASKLNSRNLQQLAKEGLLSESMIEAMEQYLEGRPGRFTQPFQFAELQKQMAELEASIKNINKDLTQQVAELQTERDAYRKQLERSRQETEQVSQQVIKQQRQRMADAARKKAELTMSRRKAQEQLALLRMRMREESDSKVAQVKEALKETKQELVKVQREAEQAREKIYQLRRERMGDAAMRKAELTKARRDHAQKLQDVKRLMREDRDNRLADLKAELREKQMIKDDLKVIRQEKEKIARRILRKPAQQMDFQYKQVLEQIQMAIDPHFRGKEKTELYKATTQLIEIPGISEMLALDVDLYLNKPLNEWSLSDLDLLLDATQALRKIGWEVYHQKLDQWKASRRQDIDDFRDNTFTGEEALFGEGSQEQKIHDRPGALGRTMLEFGRPNRVWKVLDGWKEGPLYRFFWQELNQKFNNSIKGKTARLKYGEKVLKDLKVEGDLNKKLHTVGTDPLVGERVNYTYLVDEVIHMYIGMKNEKNKAALLWGHNVTEQTVLQLIDQLTPNQKQWGDFLIKEFSEHYDSLRQAYIDYANVDLGMEENYFTMIRTDFEGKGMADILAHQWAFSQAFANKDWTKARQTINPDNQTSIRLGATSIWRGQVAKQEHFISSAQWIREANWMMERGGLKDMINFKYGREYSKWIQKYINDYANPHYFSDLTSYISSRLRRNMATGYLALNALTVGKQFASFAHFMREVHPGQLLKGITMFVTHPQQWTETIKDLAPRVHDRHVYQVFEEMLAARDKNAFDRIMRKIGDVTMRPISLMDQFTVSILWVSAYDNNLNHKNMSQQEAADAATNFILETQPASKDIDLPQIYRKDQANVVKWMLMFSNQLNQNFNTLAFDVPYAFKNGHYGKAFLEMSSIGLSMALISLISGWKPPENPEELPKEVLEEFMMNFANMIPMVGSEVSQGLAGWRGGSGSPLAIGYDIGMAGKAIVDGSDFDTIVNRLIRIGETGLLFGAGAPVTGTKRIYRSIANRDARELLGYGWTQED